ncbi:MAG: BACON domain-containing carbohydrate-binding protein, partial [Chloroherpetonaceae bacterium]
QANPLSTTRTATVTVSGSGVTSQTVTVTQAAGAATLSILPTTLDIGATEGSTATFNITSNTNWTILSDQDWLSVNPASGTGDSIITVTAQANPSASARTAIVTVSATGVDLQTITVTQEMGTGITEIETGKCAIYPNPFTNGFYVGNDHHTMIVSMFDVRGQLIFTRKVLGIEFIPTAQLANGIYLIELTNEKTIMKIKVIKQ